ncbi:MAG: hypothetical protein JSW20_01145 [Nitrospiraceae bacterium]|nr:MAG: hypothetical protein JSW20_01145 [Nitrospiraceae bacterium]
MFVGNMKSLCFILDESPFFTDLSMKERESLIEELLETYPHLLQQPAREPVIGYESRRLPKQGK